MRDDVNDDEEKRRKVILGEGGKRDRNEDDDEGMPNKSFVGNLAVLRVYEKALVIHKEPDEPTEQPIEVYGEKTAEMSDLVLVACARAEETNFMKVIHLFDEVPITECIVPPDVRPYPC